MLALLAAQRGRAAAAGAALGLALTLKPQPVIFVPLLLVYVYRWYGWRAVAWCCVAMCGTCLVVSAPYLLPPHPEIAVFVRNVGSSIARAPFASVGTFNVWWFVGVQYTPYHAPLVGNLSALGLGDAAFGVVAVVALTGVWLDRSAGRLFAAAGLLATGFFVLTALQHERYLYPAIALFLIAAVHDHRCVRYYAVASITTFLNMAAIVVLYYSGSDSGFNLAPAGTWLTTHGAYLVLVAGVNLWLLARATMMVAWNSWKSWRTRSERDGVPRERDEGRADRQSRLLDTARVSRAGPTTAPASRRESTR